MTCYEIISLIAIAVSAVVGLIGLVIAAVKLGIIIGTQIKNKSRH